MNTAISLPWPRISTSQNADVSFRAIFEHAPKAVARVNSEGVIVEMNPALEQTLDPSLANRRPLRISDLVAQKDSEKAESLLRDLLDCRRDQFTIDTVFDGKDQGGDDQVATRWVAWRQNGSNGNDNHALLIAQPRDEANVSEESPLQSQRWEAIGRLAGGVVHDFNNVLTGVMLYCDLLLSALDSRDRRRQYAEEIRSAIVQGSGLVRQLLVFSSPQAAPIRARSLNEVATGMRDLLTRLIGENITLELRLDPALSVIEIDPSQAQQILLNLVLNSRDALPNGGKITIETSNCRFQSVAGRLEGLSPAFPCVLLVVSDNGHGMDEKTRKHLFDPFFTTKKAGKGTGLGLTSVRSIVTTNHGLIHFDSETGRGTRVMILLPRASCSPDHNFSECDLPERDDPDRPISDSRASPISFQTDKKELLL